MTNQNSGQSDTIRPDDLMAELDIKKDTYYADLNYLGIKAAKDENGKAYLTNDQANLVRQLRSHVNETGKRDGFADTKGDLVHEQNGNDLATHQEEAELKLEIPTPESASGNNFKGIDIEQIISEAAKLKLTNLATPDLVKLHLAEQMDESDLPPEMREKLLAVREAANPKKSQPATIAKNLLTQWRKRQSS